MKLLEELRNLENELQTDLKALRAEFEEFEKEHRQKLVDKANQMQIRETEILKKYEAKKIDKLQRADKLLRSENKSN